VQSTSTFVAVKGKNGFEVQRTAILFPAIYSIKKLKKILIVAFDAVFF